MPIARNCAIYMVDESRYADDPLPGTRNLVAALFGLENSRSPADMRRVLVRLIDWLGEPRQTALRRHFVVWLKRVLLPSRMDGLHFSQVNDLQEIDSMLAERVKDWTKDWVERGIEQGRVAGELAVLTRQLTRRFGPLDEATMQRLQQASSANLECWADSILDARTLEEVFIRR
ncbi:MAG TPA: DUF4351 domain-containing protein [Hyphomicrobiales bacterium]|nr:DUF4351 domain-containing protein [Hyphomicrobiales bacterium]